MGLVTEQTGNPAVKGQCPGCGARSLFLGNNGYVTCSVLGCKDPSAPNRLLQDARTLPMTDDGHYIFPGDTVWLVDGEKVWSAVIRSVCRGGKVDATHHAANSVPLFAVRQNANNALADELEERANQLRDESLHLDTGYDGM